MMLEPRRFNNPMLMELETAKQILEEFFHSRPSDVEDVIQRRIEEKAGTRIAGPKKKSCGHKSSA